jgi:hypothetical protein
MEMCLHRLQASCRALSHLLFILPGTRIFSMGICALNHSGRARAFVMPDVVNEIRISSPPTPVPAAFPTLRRPFQHHITATVFGSAPFNSVLCEGFTLTTFPPSYTATIHPPMPLNGIFRVKFVLALGAKAISCAHNGRQHGGRPSTLTPLLVLARET